MPTIDEIVPHILDRLNEANIAEQWTMPGTRYAVVDDLLPSDFAHAIYDAFPRGGAGFDALNSFRECKYTTYDLDSFPLLKAAAYALQNPDVISAVSREVSFTDLETDPSLYAGGPSLMAQGHFLNPHIDNSHDGGRRRYRRLNLLYYVTPDWRSEYGGHLELWDRGVRKPVTIEARFNRLVVMETNRTSWHSVSPITVNRDRCCISSYYFSEKSPEDFDYYHVTSFTGRPGQRLNRLIAPVDNAIRRFARQILMLRRTTDQGYHESVRENA